jgi:predicted NBD/HSP70 family sugar kinase
MLETPLQKKGNRPEKVIDPSGGANQTRVRAYNERLVLSLVRRHGSLSKSDIARRSGLSPQTVSVIMRALEEDGLLRRGEPRRGQVGQPSIPMSLNADAVISIGLKIGRRSADLVLMDFVGNVRQTLHRTYAYPTPEAIIEFARTGIATLSASLGGKTGTRIAGIGVAMPFELWNWAEMVGAPSGAMDAWREFDFRAELSRICEYPVFVQNDATAACGAELVFGRGVEFNDFVYFFVGSFIGGGIVLNHSVYSGRSGNAGALGSMLMARPDTRSVQLIEKASIHVLETMLKEKGIDPSPLWLTPDDWSDFGKPLDKWITMAARHLAVAIVSSCAVIDFEAAIIDGGFPAGIRKRLVKETRKKMKHLDLQGIKAPRIIGGMAGSGARAIGGASLPLFARYLLNQNILFKDMTS